MKDFKEWSANEATRDKSPDIRAYLDRIKNPKDNRDVQLAVASLAAKKVIPELRDEVAGVLNTLLTSRDIGVRNETVRACEKWGTEVNAENLIQMAESLDILVNTAALRALGRISKSPEIAKRIAQLLQEDHVGFDAADALKNMGSVGEDAVLEVLAKNTAERPRSNAINALGGIGTQKSVSVLEGISRDASNQSLQFAAEAALNSIKQRLGKK